MQLQGLEFDRFGRRLGLTLMVGGAVRDGLYYLLNPVSLVRYFEFPFTLSQLPDRLDACLDVSSPRLFSSYVAKTCPGSHIRMINPDCADVRVTQSIAAGLALSNLQPECLGVDALRDEDARYDCIWSISVIEHISGAYDDREAIAWMYEVLRPGGRLILTFPVDRTFEEEFREQNPFGLSGTPVKNGKYFFQRRYDLAAIRERLLEPLGMPAHDMVFFGEKAPGVFDAYEERAVREGVFWTVQDPRHMAECYQIFADWETMPGTGVCGLTITKRAS